MRHAACQPQVWHACSRPSLCAQNQPRPLRAPKSSLGPWGWRVGHPYPPLPRTDQIYHLEMLLTLIPKMFSPEKVKEQLGVPGPKTPGPLGGLRPLP